MTKSSLLSGLVLTLGWMGPLSAAGDTLDLIIENGRIVDGSGNPWYWGDVGIRGKRISTVGDLEGRSATRRIDAKGRIVAPGFIDMHSHASWNYLIDPRAVSKVTQGITLEIEGEGHSVAPMDDAMAERRRGEFERFGVQGDWRSLDDFYRRLEANPGAINFATYLGTANVREMAVGFDDRAATAGEIEEMRSIVSQAMRDGALGVYSALMYAPDRYNRTEELIEMATVAAQHGGVYQTHPRSESNALDSSMNEIFRIAKEAEIAAHITHLKVAYQQNWGRMPEVIRRVEEARAVGLEITADMYPYEQASASFTALLPPWAQDGGRQEIVRRLSDPAMREQIKQELVEPADHWENEYFGTGGGPAGITLVDGGGNPELAKYEGMTLAEIGRQTGQDPRDAMFAVILAGDAGFTSLITSEKDIRLAIQQPWVAFGTDGHTVAPEGPLSEGLPHPRSYGAFPRVFGKYVRQLELVRLEEAVRRATSLAAQILNIRERGLLREGFYADVVIFDPETIADTATYRNPHQIAKGVHSVIVNGEIVLDDGKVTDARPGMVVRGPGYDPDRAGQR